MLIVCRGKATFLDHGELFFSLSSRTLNVAEFLDYLIESRNVNRIYLVGQILVSRIGNAG